MKELRSASEASISAVSVESAPAEADDDMSQAAENAKHFEKYAPVVAQFKVCMRNTL